MNVSLTPEFEKMVNKRVKSGMYNSASEVVREALRLLDEQDRLRAIKLEALRREVQEGFDNGGDLSPLLENNRSGDGGDKAPPGKAATSRRTPNPAPNFPV
jgi:putative addiction module CopG family antidote